MSGTDFYYEPQVRLAEKLAELAPLDGTSGTRSFFGNSGTEAIEACIKMARYATGRPAIIAFFGGFHGRTLGALALTASKPIQRDKLGPFMPGVYHAPYADCYRCPVGREPETCAAECLDFLDHQIFAHLVSPDEVAAIVVEPIQGEGGYVVAPDQFLQRLRSSRGRTASCSWRTKCSRGWDARGGCSPSSTPASGRMRSRWRKALPRDCRWALRRPAQT